VIEELESCTPKLHIEHVSKLEHAMLGREAENDVPVSSKAALLFPNTIGSNSSCNIVVHLPYCEIRDLHMLKH